MGCYHFHLNQLSRGKGQSAIASAAYRAGTKLECTYYGEVSDYTRKGGVVLAEIHLPQQAPERFKDRETLWNEVEWIEGNKKAQLAHSFDIALMNEFSMEENIELARRFVEEQLVARGMIADLAIHDPKKGKDKIPNPHMERMLFLHQPTLADYLRNYYDKRNAVAESYAYGTQKAKNTNLKQFAETIRFLEEQDVRTPEQLTEKIQEFDTQLKEVSQRLKKQLAALQRVNVNLYAMKEYFETRPVYLELKNKYFGREKFKEEHKKELSGYYRSERILKENLDPSGKIPEGQWKREAARLSEEIAALRKEDKRIHAMLRKYEGIKNHVEALMAEEGEGVSLPETNKREQSTETKEAVRTMKRKKKHHGMEL